MGDDESSRRLKTARLKSRGEVTEGRTGLVGQWHGNATWHIEEIAMLANHPQLMNHLNIVLLCYQKIGKTD